MIPPRPSAGPHPGFTLIELIVVIGIIAILAAVVFVAVDPARRLHASRNSRRWSDVTAILGAVRTYQSDSGGVLPGATLQALNSPGSAMIIGTSVTCSGYACPGAVAAGLAVPGSSCSVGDMATPLAPYLKRIPSDPSGTAADTKYWINKDTNGFVTVGACNPEGEGVGGGGAGPAIQVSS